MSVIGDNIGQAMADNINSLDDALKLVQLQVMQAMGNGIADNLPSGSADIPLSYLDDDVTLSADSDEKVATQHATKTYADTKVPSIRTINGYALSSNVSLDNTDIGLGNVPNLDTTNLLNDSMADSLHRHSELSSSDGSINPALYINISGQAGIGTTSPEQKLHIKGTGPINEIIETETSTSYAVQRFTTPNRSISWALGGADASANPDSFYIYDFTAAATRLLIDNTGNVGIGTTTPLDNLGGISSYDLIGLGLHIQDLGGYPRLVLDGGTPILNFMENDGAANEKSWAIFVGNGLMRFASYDDLGSAVHNDIMVLDHDTGNIGIGTSSPLGNLHIEDDVNTQMTGLLVRNANSGSAAFATIRISSDTGNSYITRTSSNHTLGSNMFIQEASGGDIIFYTDDEKMRITNAGNIGIGTSTPAGKLDVDGALYTTAAGHTVFREDIYMMSNPARIFMQNTLSGNIAILQTDASNNVILGDLNSNPALYFKSNGDRYFDGGNVGIGTSTPGNKLHVSGGFIYVDNNYGYSIYTSSGNPRGMLSLDTIDVLKIGNNNPDGNDAINFRISGIDAAAYIDSNGDVGIGTDTPGGIKLRIYDESTSTTSLAVYNSGSSFIGFNIGYLDSSHAGRLVWNTASEYFNITTTSHAYDVNILDFVTFDATNDRMGIGTAVPSKTLDVNGDISLEAGSGDYYSNDGSQGWTGTFTNGDANTVTVKNGIITDIS